MDKQIRAEMLRSEYAVEPHWVITIDGEPLDRLIARHTDKDDGTRSAYVGLVPTMLDWLEDPSGRGVVWGRVLAEEGRRRVPVLMCPDDVDLWCTVIVADVETCAQRVTWHRLGVDIGGGEGMPESIGSSVEWFADLGPWSFEIERYNACIEAFQRALSPSV